MLLKFTIVVAWLVSVCVSMARAEIQGQPGPWAMGCKFVGNDLSHVKVRGEECFATCQNTRK